MVIGNTITFDIDADGEVFYALIAPGDVCQDVGFTGTVASPGRCEGNVEGDSRLSCVPPFTLGFQGPSTIEGAPGSVVTTTYRAALENTGAPAGAQAWNIGFVVDGGDLQSDLQSPTTEGTDAEAAFSGGFEEIELIDPAENAGRRGVVSAVVLSFTDPTITLAGPGEGPKTILQFELRVTISAADESVTIISPLLGKRCLWGGTACH